MTFNPASLFYLSACLRLDNSEAELNHSILETLSRFDNSEEEILIAIKNIILCDAPFQIYSFPYVISQLPKLDKHHPVVKATLSEFSQLFIALFGEQSVIISYLFTELIDIPGGENLGNKLIQLVDLMHSIHNDLSDNDTSLAYIDIVEFGAEAITLDLLNHFCEDQEVTNFLINHLEENPNSPLNLLIENSYFHRRGRVCFLSCVELKRKLRRLDSKEAFSKHIWKNSSVSSSSDLEPDLVFLFLGYWFLFLDKNSSEAEKINNLLSELSNLDVYSKHLITVNASRREEFAQRNYEKYLRILFGNDINPNSVRYEKSSVSINIWIGSIYLLMAEYFDAAHSEPALLQMWEPIKLYDDGIAFNSRFEMISEKIASLINGKSGLSLRSKRNLQNNLRILSPWLTLDTSEKSYKNFIEIESYANWFRSLYAVRVSIISLIKPKSNKIDLFAYYLIHVSELISFCKDLLDSTALHERNKLGARVSDTLRRKPQLLKLLLVLNRDVNKLIGGNNLVELSLNYFYSLLRKENSKADSFDNFRSDVLPNILYNWVYYHSLQTNVFNADDTNQYNNYRILEEKTKTRNRVRLKVLRKFLYNDEIGRVDNCDNKLDRILLINPISISDIKSDKNLDVQTDLQVLIAIAIQRFNFAFVSNIEPLDSYRENLIEILKSVRTGSDLSYPNRFALVSMFNDFAKINEESENVFKLSIELLFHLNGLLDISLLSFRIIGHVNSLNSHKFNEAQIRVLNCLSSETSIALKTNIHERINTDRATDPLLNAQQNQRIEFLRQSLNSIQFIVSKFRNQLANKVRVVNYVHSNKANYKIFQTEVSVRNNIPFFNLPKEYKGLPPEELSLITYNSIEQTAQFYVRDIQLPKGTLNLFEWTEEEINGLLCKNSAEFYFLARCLGKVTTGRQLQYKFQISKERFDCQSLKDFEIETGEIVQLKYFFNKNNNDWVIANSYCEIISTEQKGGSLITLYRLEELTSRNLPLNYWLPCHSDIFTGYLQSTIPVHGVPILIGENNKPIFNFLNTLLMRLKDVNERIILTFVNMEWDEDRQEFGYLFYERLGLYFLLFDGEITFPGSKDITFIQFVQSEVGDGGTQFSLLNGLLVSFRVSFSNPNIKLSLVMDKETSDCESDERFPFLQTPFDDRNIRWRTMFDESENIEFTARKIRGDWVCVISNDWRKIGFNEPIFVTLDKYPQHKNEIDFLLEDGWSSDGGRFKHFIIGQIIERRKIEVSQLKKYLLLEEHQKLEIKKALQFSKKSASVFCVTMDSYFVNINLEELTFLPFDLREQNNFNKMLTGRNFFVGYVGNWKEINSELIILNFPYELLQDKISIQGYFLNVPSRKEQGIGSCSIVLEISQNVLSKEFLIEIENISNEEIQRGLAVYSKLEGRMINNKWHFYILTRQIFLKSSRKLREIQSRYYDDYYFLGKANFNNEVICLFEKQNELGILYYSNQYDDSILGNDLFEGNDQINSNWFSQVLGKNAPRIGFLNHERIITGNIFGRNNLQINQIAILKSISFRFEYFEQDEYFVRRNFTIGIREQQQRKEAILGQSKYREQETEKRLKLLREYFDSPYALHGSIEREQLKAVITDTSKLNWVLLKEEWTNKLSLSIFSNESIEDLVFVPSAVPNYNLRDAIFWLRKNIDDTIYATLKLGYQTLENLFEKYDFKVDDVFDVSSNKIYFVDKEKVDPFTMVEHEEEMYRFEEGFGKNILIPSDRLLWNGNPIKTGDLVLFHSDAIKKFNFTKVSVGGTDIIKLNIVFIEISQAHRLYLQARDHNIYHLAHIGCNEKGIYIKHVKGVDENSIKDNSMTTIYDRIHATFDDISKRLLESRFDSNKETLEKIVLVKVDTSLFKKSGRLQFNHYKLTYISDKANKDIRIIQDNARIIMELGFIGITKSGNDYYVKVKPNQLLAKEDIGQDFLSGILLRREFSLNEGLLREFYRRGDTNYFEGFEVYLTVRSYGRNQVSYSLVKNSVFRKQEVLYAFKGRNIIGISKDKSTTTQVLVVEVKPGNFLRLQNSKLEFRDIPLINEGDVLSILVNQNLTFTIESAIAGDYRFLENNRKVVVLPKDSVFNSTALGSRYNSTAYTIGGLPNIELNFQNFDTNRNVDFLLQHHPKIASIRKDNFNGEEQCFLTPRLDTETSKHGYILIAEGSNELKFVSKEEGKEKQFQIKWNNVSFYDESASDLIRRIKRYRWQYHDEQSRNLTLGVNGFEPGEPYELLPSTINETGTNDFISGPIFCEFADRTINLRVVNRLPFWGYPVSSLIDFLDYIKVAYTFSYIGKEGNIHFIEMAPGRIVELPINLLVLKINSIEIHMKNYAWDFLSVGDEIKLKNITDDLSDLYKIELISITHSLRNVLNRVSKLPINKVDKDKGFIELGSERCILRLPISHNASNFDVNKPIEFISRTNQFTHHLNTMILNNGNTVLLSLNKENYLCFLGFNDLRPDYIDYLKRDEIKEFVKACGGAIPVNVIISDKQKVVQFELPSLKAQEINLDAKIISGFVVNALNQNYQELVLKIGGYFAIVPFENIMSGLSKEQRKFATHFLKNKQVWLKVSFDKFNRAYSLISGLSQDVPGSEISVNKINHVTDNKGNFIGTICRANISHQYYWMPEREMAWCNIKPNVADFVFYNASDNGVKQISVSIRVKICSGKLGNFISRVKTTELYNSFKKKRCGSDNIDVLIISPPIKSSDSKLSFIGFSLLHKVLVYCVLFDEQSSRIPKLNEVVKTEVIEKDVTGLKIKTLFGVKKILLHIPIYLKTSLSLQESVIARELNENINHYLNYSNAELISNSSEIKNAYISIFSKKGNDAASLKSGFIVLEKLCILQNINNSYNYILQIETLLNLLKLNLLRHICIETLNNNEPHKLHDHYLDFILLDSLKPFYSSQEVFVTELELSKLRKTALTLCFQSQGKRYPAIGNSILQALGLKSHLDTKIILNSTLYKIYKMLLTYSRTEDLMIKNDFVHLIRKAIKIFETNQIKISLLQERID